MHFCRLSAIALLGLALFPKHIAAAQDTTAETMEADTQTPLEIRANQVVDLVNGEIEPEAIFSDSFLTALPPPQIKAFSQGLVAQFGRALRVEKIAPKEGTRAALEMRFERGLAKGGLAILPGEENRVSELLFNSVEPISAFDDSAEKIAEDLASLPGEVSAYFGPLDGSLPVLALQPDRQFALGSTFKLYVLAALAQDIAEGKRNWDDVITLDTTSLPSGMMQDWPQGSPATLHTYASLMISISDNTATDQLIKELGRESILETLKNTGHSNPGLNEPFMTTRELFELKGGPEDRRRAYSDAAGDTPARIAILSSIPSAPAPVEKIQAAFAGNPIALDIEWFASADDLSKLLRYMRKNAPRQTFGVMAINKGLPDSVFKNWSYVGYKGGSEPGVLQMTWLLTDQSGIDFMLALSWNNPDAPVETETLLGFAQRLLNLPR